MPTKKKMIKIFCTLGPSSMSGETINKLTDLGVDMFRINLSHTNIASLEDVVAQIKRYTTRPICLDTEGAQIRIRRVDNGNIHLEDDATVEIAGEEIIGTPGKISFAPALCLKDIKPGDLISIDFNAVLLQAIRCVEDLVTAKVISGGHVGSNKAVTIDRYIRLPVISEKDKKAIKIGQKMGIRHFALSFANDKASVEYFR